MAAAGRGVPLGGRDLAVAIDVEAREPLGGARLMGRGALGVGQRAVAVGVVRREPVAGRPAALAAPAAPAVGIARRLAGGQLGLGQRAVAVGVEAREVGGHVVRAGRPARRR
jgi:hypothetical protein